MPRTNLRVTTTNTPQVPTWNGINFLWPVQFDMPVTAPEPPPDPELVELVEEINAKKPSLLQSTREVLEEFKKLYTPDKWLPSFCFKDGALVAELATSEKPLPTSALGTAPRMSIHNFLYLLRKRMIMKSFATEAENFLDMGVNKVYSPPEGIKWNLTTFQGRILPLEGMTGLVRVTDAAISLLLSHQKRTRLEYERILEQQRRIYGE